MAEVVEEQGRVQEALPCSFRMKRCCKCKKFKSHALFSRLRTAPDGCQKSCKQCNADWQKANPEKRRQTWNRYRRKRYLDNKYGLTESEVESMKIAQGGLCAICRREPGPRGLQVDHDHATGAVRALLCWKCNTGLGAFQDDLGFVLAAAAYINKYRSEDYG